MVPYVPLLSRKCAAVTTALVSCFARWPVTRRSVIFPILVVMRRALTPIRRTQKNLCVAIRTKSLLAGRGVLCGSLHIDSRCAKPLVCEAAATLEFQSTAASLPHILTTPLRQSQQLSCQFSTSPAPRCAKPPRRGETNPDSASPTRIRTVKKSETIRRKSEFCGVVKVSPSVVRMSHSVDFVSWSVDFVSHSVDFRSVLAPSLGSMAVDISPEMSPRCGKIARSSARIFDPKMAFWDAKMTKTDQKSLRNCDLRRFCHRFFVAFEGLRAE